jgi:hypothetical protein
VVRRQALDWAVRHNTDATGLARAPQLHVPAIAEANMGRWRVLTWPKLRSRPEVPYESDCRFMASPPESSWSIRRSLRMLQPPGDTESAHEAETQTELWSFGWLSAAIVMPHACGHPLCTAQSSMQRCAQPLVGSRQLSEEHSWSKLEDALDCGVGHKVACDGVAADAHRQGNRHKQR